MKTKYKLYILLYVFGVSLLDTMIVMTIMLRNPDNMLWVGAVGFLIHIIILMTGTRFLARLAKRDPPA